MRLQEFQLQLAQQGKDYQLLQLASDSAHYRFVGRFEGREIIWDAHVHALGSQGEEQYIDIGEYRGGLRTIAIGLLVDVLDEPVLRKTMLMVRQYKRLRQGRHGFLGPAKQENKRDDH